MQVIVLLRLRDFSLTKPVPGAIHKLSLGMELWIMRHTVDPRQGRLFDPFEGMIPPLGLDRIHNGSVWIQEPVFHSDSFSKSRPV